MYASTVGRMMVSAVDNEKEHSVAEVIRRMKEKLVYSNKYLHLYDDDVHFPSGNAGTYVRVRWAAPYSVAVLAKTPRDEYVLIRQYNYAREDWMLQVPKGMGEAALSPIEAAEKELLEETGYGADSFSLMKTVYVEPGFISNPTHIVFAHEAKRLREPKHERAEVIGEVVLVKLNREGLERWLSEIADCSTLCAILCDITSQQAQRAN
jgi:ADP-ribose pyrophosphatase